MCDRRSAPEESGLRPERTKLPTRARPSAGGVSSWTRAACCGPTTSARSHQAPRAAVSMNTDGDDQIPANEGRYGSKAAFHIVCSESRRRRVWRGGHAMRSLAWARAELVQDACSPA